ncbi:UNVERIFIED_CONTAM: dienelactone hydrolase [Brevibacillus sp. OAP136]
MSGQAFLIEAGENRTIRGNVHDNGQAAGGAKPILIFCHGFKGFKDWGSFPYACEQLAHRGITVIRINFSHNGVGETDFDELDKFAINTYEKELEDLATVVGELNAGRLPVPQAADKNQLFIVGHSKGGGDAILFGAHHPQVKGIITWNGIADVNLFDARLRKEIAENGVGYIANARTRQQMPITQAVIDDVDRNREAYDLLAKVREMEQPLLIVQGDADFDRLVEGSKRLHAADADSRLHVIAAGDHVWNTRHPFAGTTPQLEEVIEVTSNFIQDISHP